MESSIRTATPDDQEWVVSVVDNWWGDPSRRQLGVAKGLFEKFFELARDNSRSTARAITAPVNDGSKRFHRRMGFAVSEPIDGYNRPGTSQLVATLAL